MKQWLAVLAATAAVAAVGLAGCGGSGSSAPPVGAARIVPSDALAYVNVSIDPGRPAVGQALKVLKRFPDFALGAADVQARLAALLGAPTPGGFAHAVRPWLGREAAVALLNTSTATVDDLVVLAVRDRGAAEKYLTAGGATRSSTYAGLPLLSTSGGPDAAFVGPYLVLGAAGSVRAAIDVSNGRAGSLAASAAFVRASVGQPAGRVLDAYASAAGLRALFTSKQGLAGALGGLLYQPSLAGVSLAVSPAATGFHMRIHSVLDRTLQKVSGGSGRGFSPTLQHVVPSGSMLLLDAGGLDKLAPRILAAGATAGILGQIGPLLTRLGAALNSEGVNVAALESLFSGETAVAITSLSSKPALLIVTRTKNATQVQGELATAAIPLEQLFPQASGAGPGQAQALTQTEVDGITVNQLALAPGLSLDYAVGNGLVMLATDTDAIASVIKQGKTLSDDRSYQAALSSAPGHLTSLLFLDSSQLLSLGDQTGLTKTRTFRALRADLQQVRAVGLDSTSGEAESTAELFFQIP